MHYLAGVATIELDAEACTGCGMCTHVCPQDVFAVEKGKARIADRDACMECGACALNCPAGALKVRSGVGCANAVIMGMLGGAKPGRKCSGDSSCCC